MRIILIVILITSVFVNADIINIKILKEKNETKIYFDDKLVSARKGKEEKLINVHLNRDKLFYKKAYEYNNFKVLKKEAIKKKYIIDKDILKVFIPEKECIEIFKIEAKPDKPRRYKK